MNVYTWSVDSDVPELCRSQQYISDSRGLWDDYQLNYVRQQVLRQSMRAKGVTDEARKKARVALDSMQAVSDDINRRIDANVMTRMKKLPVDGIWMDNLRGLASSVRYDKGYPYRDEVVALYNGLSDADKNSSEGQNVHTLLFPPKPVEEGDSIADGELYDLQGNVHHLSDFSGKYVLLDFWSRGCGPCRLAVPEMREIASQYKDRLVMVSLTSDDEKGWRKASEELEMTWWNLSDRKGRNGLYAKYGTYGIPHYVLISPDGKVVRKWMGYGKGSLKKKMAELIGGK